MSVQPDVLIFNEEDCKPSTSDFDVDKVVPPPNQDTLPHGYREILLLETHGTPYIAIDHVLAELFRDRNRVRTFIYDNKTTILYDALLKIALCTTLVFHQGKTKVNAKRSVDADISQRLGYSSTVARAVKGFFNIAEYADFTFAVSIGTTKSDSVLFIRKRDGKFSFRHYNPTQKNLAIVDEFCGGKNGVTTKRPLDLLGYISRINCENSTSLVWYEIKMFMLGYHNPFNHPDSEFLKLDKKTYMYPQDPNSHGGRRVSQL